MANIVLGCDKNGVNDSKCINTVAKILTKAGHKVEKLPISPTPFGDYGYKSKAKGKIGIYLMASSLVSVTDVASSGWKFKYTYFGIRGDVSKLIRSVSDFNKKGIPKDHHGDCTNSFCNKWAGKTYPQINEIIKNKGRVTFGKNPEDIGNALVSLIGGTGDNKNNKGSEGGGSNVKDCIQKLLKHWDGDVECYIRGDEIHINKVRNPEKYYSCMLKEEVNVITDSISITDVNPDTPNHLIVTWSGGNIEFRDEKAIVRFGEKQKVVPAVKKVTKTVIEPVKKTESTDSEETTDETTDETS